VNGASHRLVQVPPGVQCFLGDEARRRRNPGAPAARASFPPSRDLRPARRKRA